MRRLLYIPIIHTESDMGSLAAEIESKNASLVGRQRWAKHKTIVASFWKAVEDHLASIDGPNLKIYQDGMAAEGDLGRKIVEESARRGSKNYQIVLRLIDGGAEIRKTEDVSLLLEEYKQIRNLTKEKSSADKLRDYADYKLRKEFLTKERDKFIAQRINESLRSGETGILFIGAYHNVLSYLDRDIVVEFVKDPDKIKAYFDELLVGRDEERFERLGQYVAAAIVDDGK